MTVIRGKKNINYPAPNSAVASDTESLNLGSVSASDAESVDNEPQNRIRLLRPRPPKLSQVGELITIKRNSGRKKLRRYQNGCILQTLDEEDEKENYVTIMESYKGPFTRLLEDPAAMECWNSFIEKSEEEQSEIVKAFSDKYCNHSAPDSKNDSETPGYISSRIRRTFRIRKNLSLEIIHDCEEDLIEFFKATPDDIYIKYPPTSFDRLLIHAIAQYHRLKSISTFVENGNRLQ
ncbi:hypothetical protein JTB14_010190 [Gonioctena quinquepunctata]|nr:hypothetical protein JTB14_010190 [Gonioctena quinquepunctata]